MLICYKVAYLSELKRDSDIEAGPDRSFYLRNFDFTFAFIQLSTVMHSKNQFFHIFTINNVKNSYLDAVKLIFKFILDFLFVFLVMQIYFCFWLIIILNPQIAW